MAVAVPYVMMAAAAASAYSQYQQGKAARAAAKEQSNLIKQQTEEEARRLEAQQSKEAASNRARIAASGITSGSESSSLVMQDMLSEQESEVAWLKKSGYNKARMAELTAPSASATNLGALSTLAGGVASAYSSGISSGQFSAPSWWKS